MFRTEKLFILAVLKSIVMLPWLFWKVAHNSEYVSEDYENYSYAAITGIFPYSVFTLFLYSYDYDVLGLLFLIFTLMQIPVIYLKILEMISND